jgi:hypothetical protein
MLLLPLLAALLVASAASFRVNLTVWDQSNVVERWPNLAQRVRVQNITDIYGQPLMLAADDVVLPDAAYFRSLGAANGLLDCVFMTLEFSAIRLRSYHNPSSLTLQVMRDADGVPGALLYQKSWAWAVNDYQWQRDWLGLPWPYQLTLHWNELGDDGVTRFNFRNPAFLPPLQRLWLAVYCTGAQEASSAKLNAMYWVTQSETANATALSAQLYGGAVNREFQYRVTDPGGVMRVGFANWSSATQYQQLAGPVAPTGQLAWRLWFGCQVPSPPTPSPSAAPTTRAPTETSRPSAAPTAPTDAPTNASLVQQAAPYPSASAVAVGVAVPLSLLCLVLGIFFVVRFMRRRRAAQRLAEAQQQTGAHSQLVVRRQQKQFADYQEIPLDDMSGARTDARSGGVFLDAFYDSGVHTASDHD